MKEHRVIGHTDKEMLMLMEWPDSMKIRCQKGRELL